MANEVPNVDVENIKGFPPLGPSERTGPLGNGERTGRAKIHWKAAVCARVCPASPSEILGSSAQISVDTVVLAVTSSSSTTW